MAEKSCKIDSVEQLINVFGNMDENIQIVQDAFDVSIVSRDGEIKVSGNDEDVDRAIQVVGRLLDIASLGEVVSRQNVSYLVRLAANGELGFADGYMEDCICITAKGRRLKWKTHGQKNYIEKIEKKDIVFGIGPAGTGKTYLAIL